MVVLGGILFPMSEVPCKYINQKPRAPKGSVQVFAKLQRVEIKSTQEKLARAADMKHTVVGTYA